MKKRYLIVAALCLGLGAASEQALAQAATSTPSGVVGKRGVGNNPIDGPSGTGGAGSDVGVGATTGQGLGGAAVTGGGMGGGGTGSGMGPAGPAGMPGRGLDTGTDASNTARANP